MMNKMMKKVGVYACRYTTLTYIDRGRRKRSLYCTARLLGVYHSWFHDNNDTNDIALLMSFTRLRVTV